MESDFADQVAVAGRENVNAVAAAGPDAPIYVAMNAVGNAIGHVGKDCATSQCVAGGYGINLDAMTAVVRVGHVKSGFIRRETQAVGTDEAAGDDGTARGIAVGGMKLINVIARLEPGLRWRAYSAVVAGVGEPDSAIGFHGHIVRRVKLQSITGGDQRGHGAVGDHGNLQSGASRFRPDQAFLRVEDRAVEQSACRGQQKICDGGRWNELSETVVVLVAEHQKAAGRNPRWTFQPGVDRGVGDVDDVGIDDFVELDGIGDLKRHRSRGLKQEHPRNHASKSISDSFQMMAVKRL